MIFDRLRWVAVRLRPECCDRPRGGAADAEVRAVARRRRAVNSEREPQAGVEYVGVKQFERRPKDGAAIASRAAAGSTSRRGTVDVQPTVLTHSVVS